MSPTSLSLLVQFMTLAAALATVVSVWIAFHIYRKQMNAQVFITFTQRYEAIMGSLPEAAVCARFNAAEELPPESPALTLAILRYLNLCSEEYYLCKKKYLDRSLWAIWEDELKRMLRSPLVLREWPKLRSEFESYQEFLRYAEEVQKSGDAGEARPRQVSTARDSAPAQVPSAFDAALTPAAPGRDAVPMTFPDRD